MDIKFSLSSEDIIKDKVGKYGSEFSFLELKEENGEFCILNTPTSPTLYYMQKDEKLLFANNIPAFEEFFGKENLEENKTFFNFGTFSKLLAENCVDGEINDCAFYNGIHRVPVGAKVIFSVKDQKFFSYKFLYDSLQCFYLIEKDEVEKELVEWEKKVEQKIRGLLNENVVVKLTEPNTSYLILEICNKLGLLKSPTCEVVRSAFFKDDETIKFFEETFGIKIKDIKKNFFRKKQKDLTFFNYAIRDSKEARDVEKKKTYLITDRSVRKVFKHPFKLYDQAAMIKSVFFEMSLQDALSNIQTYYPFLEDSILKIAWQKGMFSQIFKIGQDILNN